MLLSFLDSCWNLRCKCPPIGLLSMGPASPLVSSLLLVLAILPPGMWALLSALPHAAICICSSYWAFTFAFVSGWLLKMLPFSRGYHFKVLSPEDIQHNCKSLMRFFKFKWTLFLQDSTPCPWLSLLWSFPGHCALGRVLGICSRTADAACSLVNRYTHRFTPYKTAQHWEGNWQSVMRDEWGWMVRACLMEQVMLSRALSDPKAKAF